MAFSRAAHSRLTPRDHADTFRAPLARESDTEGVSKAMRFIEEYEARKALVVSDRNARPASRRKRPDKADATQSPTRTVPRSRTVDRARVDAAAETTNRSKSRPRSSSTHRSKPVSTYSCTFTGASTAPQAATLPRDSAAAYASQTEGMNYARELEKEVERLRRELKAEARGRLEDTARRDEVESSRAGSMQATVAKLRVQLDASKRREEETQTALNDLRKERGTVHDKEAENSALRAQLADVRAQAEADRRAAKAAQSSLESKLRNVILKQSYRNSPDKCGEMTSAVDRRRVERDAETIVQHNRRRSLGTATVAVSPATDLNNQPMGHEVKQTDNIEASITDVVATIPSETVESSHQQDPINEGVLAGLAAERDDAQEKLANLSKVCKALELKVASQDKRIRQLAEATTIAEQNAQIQTKERELMAIQKERLTFQLQRYRKQERKSNLNKSDPSTTNGPGTSASSIFDGVSDKVRTLAEELAKQLMDVERQKWEECKEIVAAQEHTISKLNSKIAQLRVALGKKAADSQDSSADSPSRGGRTNRANITRSPLRVLPVRRNADASCENRLARPSTMTVQDEAHEEANQAAEEVDKSADTSLSGAKPATNHASREKYAGQVEPELWASSVATALAFRALKQGIQASRDESSTRRPGPEREARDPDQEPEPEPEPVPERERVPGLPTLSPGDRLFKFATRLPATNDEDASRAESSESQAWDIDITSANSTSFLGATLRGGRSPPRSSPVQMFDEGRLPRVGAGSLFGLATGSI